jgi:hypothetical protein
MTLFIRRCESQLTINEQIQSQFNDNGYLTSPNCPNPYFSMDSTCMEPQTDLMEAWLQS